MSALKSNLDAANATSDSDREGALQEAKEKNKMLMESHEKWVADSKAHFDEVIEVDIFQTPIVEINDTTHIIKQEGESERSYETRLALQNQALIYALIPIFKE